MAPYTITEAKTMYRIQEQYKMNKQFKQKLNKPKSRCKKVDTSIRFVLDVLLPDFLIFVVGISVGIGLMLYLFQI